MGDVASGMGIGFLSGFPNMGDEVGGFLGGEGGLADSLGLSGKQGEYMRNAEANPALAAMQRRSALYGDTSFNSALNGYANGGYGSFMDAINGRKDGLSQDELANALATDPRTGTKMATEQVQNNPILAQLFGKGGSMEGARAEEQDLMKNGYGLNQQDHEAYGQASGNIARMFGQQENDLASSLANRGLSQAGSGSALAGFAGLQGNKMEQLASSQRQIADSRMNNTRERLNQTRTYLSDMGKQGASAIDQQATRNLNGVKQKQNYDSNIAANTSNDNNIINQGRLASLADKRGAKGSTLLEGLGQGLYSSSVNIGASPGKAASSSAGSFGSSMGGGMGK